MAFSVTEFQGQMQFGGARPSLFEVNITNPFNSSADDKVRFMCRTASAFHASTIECDFYVSYFGRPVKFAGNRTFEEWSVTIINDEDFAVRSTLEEWHQNINTVQGNVRQAGAGPEAYKSQGSVIQYGKQGNILREYKFVGIFPVTIPAIELSWDTADAIEEFAVTFAYDYFTVDNASEFSIAINT
jgi:hypothetical protein